MELTQQQHTATLEWIKTSALLRKNRTAAQQKALKEELTTLVARHKEQAGKIAKLKAQREDIQKQLRALNAKSTDLAAEIQRSEERMNDGTGMTSHDLVAMGKEVDGLKERLAGVEDQHLAGLQQEESVTAELERATEEGHAIASQGKQLQEERAQTASRLDAEARELSAQLAGLRKQMGNFGDLVAQRADEGTGAAVLRGGACGGCGAALSGSALHELMNASPLSVTECEDCESFVIRES